VERKESILKAAKQLFAQRGFHATATSFKTKEGILVYLFEEMMDLYIEGAKSWIEKAKSGLEAIEELVSFHFLFSEQRAEELMVVIRDFPFTVMKQGSPFREVANTHFFRVVNIIRECIEQGQADGSIRDIPSEKTALILQGMLYGLSRFKLLGPLELPDLSSQVVDLCRFGLGKGAQDNQRKGVRSCKR
jgi:AcrR family transcriptional regulator